MLITGFVGGVVKMCSRVWKQMFEMNLFRIVFVLADLHATEKQSTNKGILV